MSDANRKQERFRRDIGGLLLAGVAVGFFASPLMRLANPISLFIGGMLLGPALFFAYQTRVIQAGRFLMRLAWCFGVAGGCLLGWTFIDAARSAAWLDVECDKLQLAMDRGTTERFVGQPDAKDRFAAYGCQPRELPPRLSLPPQS